MKGRTLAHYEILDKLGEGGMGAVWQARDTRLNRIVAIKTLPADKVADARRKRRFVQEAQAASALNHPNIVTIYDIDSDNGADFTKAPRGLWSLPVTGGQETVVLESVRTGGVDVTDKGVYFLSGLSGQVIQFFSFGNHNLTRIGEIGKPVSTGRPPLSVTRDDRWIAWTQLDHQDSDLMLLESFR